MTDQVQQSHRPHEAEHGERRQLSEVLEQHDKGTALVSESEKTQQEQQRNNEPEQQQNSDAAIEKGRKEVTDNNSMNANAEDTNATAEDFNTGSGSSKKKSE